MCPTASTPAPLERSARKRKAPAHYGDEDVPLECQSPPAKSSKSSKSSKPSKPKAAPETTDHTENPPHVTEKTSKCGSDAPVEEKRLRRFRVHPPGSYIAVKDRALTQRLTVLSRERHGSDEVPEEKVLIAGSTGNVYTVNIGRIPECDCPHANKGNQCKHIIYVLIRVLKAQEHVAYQLALLGSELRDVIGNAPPIPGLKADAEKSCDEEQNENRKTIEGECPICYDDLEPEKDVIVYCQASCGNNVHRMCMQTWIAMATRGKATCPYCRAIWAIDNGPEIKLGDIDTKGLERNEDGYVNVAGQLGISGERDYSSYHQFWVRRNLGMGGGWNND
jgi:uncharacterized Zn-finger protein